MGLGGGVGNNGCCGLGSLWKDGVGRCGFVERWVGEGGWK